MTTRKIVACADDAPEPEWVETNGRIIAANGIIAEQNRAIATMYGALLTVRDAAKTGRPLPAEVTAQIETVIAQIEDRPQRRLS